VREKGKNGRFIQVVDDNEKKNVIRKREMRITFQGLSGNLNPYNHPDCNHVEVLKPPVKRT